MLRFAFTLLSMCALLLVGCDAVDNAIDCRDVCSRYSECFDSDFDVDECVDSCREEADSNDDAERDLDACADCIDEYSCTGATLHCGTLCVGVIL